MKSSLRNNILIIILTLLSVVVFEKVYKKIKKYNSVHPFTRYTDIIKEAYNWELQEQKSEPKMAVFNDQGIDDIALITMIKDEDDIIYQNLVWHFSIGFRKFVIVDNNSTDNTRMLVNKFRDEVRGKAQVIIIDDPIKEYIQAAVTTGAMKFANLVWPKVEWVFPVDADEFWYPETKLDIILQNIPKEKNAIQVLQHDYFPTEKDDKFNGTIPFYQSITCRTKFKPGGGSLLGKAATKPGQNMFIMQGNHQVYKDNDSDYTKYISGNMIGLKMLHFQRRSVAQVQKKYSNGAAANILGQNMGIIDKVNGVHWTSFALEAEQKGVQQAAKDRFNEWVAEKEQCINAPLSMDAAFELYQTIIKD